jgi:hypothetical protein
MSSISLSLPRPTGKLLCQINGRNKPFDTSRWHQWETGRFVRTIDGHWTVGAVWRRARNGRWEYQEREESEEDWLARQV